MIVNFCIWCENIWLKIDTEYLRNFGIRSRVCSECIGKHLSSIE